MTDKKNVDTIFKYPEVLDHELISNKDWNEISKHVNVEVAKAKQEANL